MANIDKPNGFRAVKNLAGGAFPVFTLDTTSNLTLAPGDALIMNSNGTLGIALATSTMIVGVSQSKITGVSATRQKCQYIPTLPSIQFSGQCSGTYSPVNAGEGVDIEGTTGIMEVNENLQTAAVLRIVGLEGGIKNAAGTNARVLFHWVKTPYVG